MMPCTQSFQSFPEVLSEKVDLQEVKNSIKVAGKAVLKLANSKSLPHNLQLKGQWINK